MKGELGKDLITVRPEVWTFAGYSDSSIIKKPWLMPAPGREWQLDLCKLKDSLFHIVNSRPPRLHSETLQEEEEEATAATATSTTKEHNHPHIKANSKLFTFLHTIISLHLTGKKTKICGS